MGVCDRWSPLFCHYGDLNFREQGDCDCWSFLLFHCCHCGNLSSREQGCVTGGQLCSVIVAIVWI